MVRVSSVMVPGVLAGVSTSILSVVAARLGAVVPASTTNLVLPLAGH